MKRAAKQKLRAQASIVAMKGLIQASGFGLKTIEGKPFQHYLPELSNEEIACMAVSYADALIAELNKEGGLK